MVAHPVIIGMVAGVWRAVMKVRAGPIPEPGREPTASLPHLVAVPARIGITEAVVAGLTLIMAEGHTPQIHARV